MQRQFDVTPMILLLYGEGEWGFAEVIEVPDQLTLSYHKVVHPGQPDILAEPFKSILAQRKQLMVSQTLAGWP